MPSSLITSKGSVSIRPAVPQDAADLLSLRIESLTLHPQAFAADIDMTEKSGVEAWSERIHENTRESSGVILVAEAEQSSLVGMMGLARGHWPKTRHSATLWGVYVRPAWRGLHIGEALVNACAEWGSLNNLAVLYLGVLTTNQAAIGCYTRCGFTPYGTEPRVIYYDGIYYDELLMARLL